MNMNRKICFVSFSIINLFEAKNLKFSEILSKKKSQPISLKTVKCINVVYLYCVETLLRTVLLRNDLSFL